MSVEAVRRYYEETVLDYRILWMGRAARAMHFGLWKPGVRTHAESLEAMNRELTERLAIKPGERVLDAGCGVGGSALWLAENRGAHVTGVTVVRFQARRARRYARQRGVENVRFLVADMTRTPFSDASFDVVWALESVCHVDDKRRFFHEARRLLRPGGRLGMAEYVRIDGRSDADMRTWLDGWSMPNLATAYELVAMATEAGFVNVTTDDVTRYVGRSSRRMHEVARFLWPLQWWLHAIGIRTERQHAHVRGTLAQYELLRRGRWRYVLLTAAV